MKSRTLALLLSILPVTMAFSETFNMKDGTKVQGEILSEQEDSYTVSVQVTATIKDERKILKADIASVDEDSPADGAFEAIAGLVPTADHLTLADYDLMIEKQVKAFLSAFPKTKHTRKATEILETLEKERQMAAAGGLKIDGTWISPADRQANAYELDARIAYENLLAAAEAERFRVALRQFEKIEEEFPSTESFGKAVDLAKRILRSYSTVVNEGLRTVDELVANREKELMTLPAGQRAAALAEVKRNEAGYAALLEKEKASGTRWFSLEMYHKEPLTETARTIESELKRLESIDPALIKTAGPLYREAWAAARGGRIDEAKKLFVDLASLKVPARYIALLEEQLPKPVEPGTDPVTPPVTPEKPPVVPGDGGEPEVPEVPATPPAEPTKPPVKEPATDPAPETVPAATEENSGGLSMTTILFAVMGVVLIIAVVAIFTGGKKRPE